MTERAADPYGAHRFRVRCAALPCLAFTAVRGLEVAVEERGDDDPPAGRRRRGRGPFRRPRRPDRACETRSPPLELHRGVSADDALWAWLQEWVAGEADPQDVHVCLLDAADTPVRGWVCRAARPVRWRGPDLVADPPAVATETLELTHEGIEALADLSACEGG